MDSDINEADYYKKAFEEYPNYDWKEMIDLPVVDFSSSNWAKDIVEQLFSRGFDEAYRQTISVGRKFMIPYAPGGDKVYILHGKNENIDGGAIFGISIKSKKQVLQNMVDWVSDFINYYDPQI